ncbi:unnamed protein product [marine sediment metagenome]|uniref:Uncharacterized protein n=1 Tax=marine sediment metagenome TaxID=412755 RepID=X1RJ74_9ZZZZ
MLLWLAARIEDSNRVKWTQLGNGVEGSRRDGGVPPGGGGEGAFSYSHSYRYPVVVVARGGFPKGGTAAKPEPRKA